MKTPSDPIIGLMNLGSNLVFACFGCVIGLLFCPWAAVLVKTAKQQNIRCPEHAAHGLEHANTFVCHIHIIVSGHFVSIVHQDQCRDMLAVLLFWGETAKQQTKQQNSKSPDWRYTYFFDSDHQYDRSVFTSLNFSANGMFYLKVAKNPGGGE